MLTTRGALWTTASALSVSVLKLGVTAVLARLLSPVDFGLVALATGVVALVESIGRLGVGPAIVQRPALSKSDTLSAIWLSLGLGSVLTLVLMAMSEVVSAFFNEPPLAAVMRALAPICLITAIGSVPNALMQREMRFAALSRISLGSYVVGYGAVTISLSALDYGHWALITGMLASSAVQTTLFIAHTPVQSIVGGRPTQAGVMTILRYGVAWSVGEIGYAMAAHADRLISGRVLGAEATGIYTRAFIAISAPANLLGAALDKVLFSSLSRLQRSPARLRSAFIESLAAVLTVTLPGSALIYVLAPEIVNTLFGEQWTQAIRPLELLAVGVAFRIGFKTSEALARAAGVLYARAWRQYVFALAITVLAGAGSALNGLPGLAAGVSIAYAMNYALMLQLSMRVLSLSRRELVAVHIRPLALAVVLVAVALTATTVSRSLGAPDVLTIAVATASLVTAQLTVGATLRASLGADTYAVAQRIIRALRRRR